MYACSEEFHQSIANGNPQMAMLIFNDAVFTNEDIDVSRGIEFNDYFNAEEDLTIGQALSNEVYFSLFNDNRLLNDYTFGEFLATIGVLVGMEGYKQVGSVTITTGNARWVGYAEYPYVRRNDSAVLSQPSFPVMSMLGYEGKVWVFSDDGRFAVYDDATGTNITQQNPLNAFMKDKSKRWAGKGLYYNRSSRILFIYEGGTRQRYEFVPLGLFIAERPKAPDVIEIDMTCNDFMMKFEKDMPNKEQLGISYPISFGGLLKKLCDYVGVSLKTVVFINSNAIIKKEPGEFENATMRDVIGWIAEAAGGNARIDRDGELVIDWLRETGQVINADGYETFNPYWYQTKKITQLYNRSTDGSYDNHVGNGDEGYLIQDNPLLRGVN